MRLVLALLLSIALGARLRAAEEPTPAPEAPSSHMKEVLKLRAEEEAKKKPAAPAPAPKAAKPAEKNPSAATDATPTAAPASTPTPAPAAATTKDASTAKPAAPEQPPTMLPKVEVKKDRVTVLDHNLAVQQKEIEREKKNTTPTELDKALNDSKVSKALSIFGGQSGDYRANISKERVQMMEEEKEVIEAIAHAKTKEEKAELQKELDQMRALRRELEKTLR